MARIITTDRERLGTTKAEFDDGDNITLTYRRGALTPDFLTTMHQRRVADVLADVLVEWDLQDDERQPIQPPSLSDSAHWIEAAREARVSRLITQRVEEASKTKQPVAMPTDQESADLRAAPPTSAECKAVYVAAWRALLAGIPQFILLTVYRAIIEDIRPGN